MRKLLIDRDLQFCMPLFFPSGMHGVCMVLIRIGPAGRPIHARINVLRRAGSC